MSPCQPGRGMKISGTFSIGQRPGVTRTKIAKKDMELLRIRGTLSIALF